MTTLDRRALLLAAAGLAAALAGCSTGEPPAPLAAGTAPAGRGATGPRTRPTGRPSAAATRGPGAPTVPPGSSPPPPPRPGVPLSHQRLFGPPATHERALQADPGPVVVSRPPRRLASDLLLTIDDGVDSATVGAYVELARITGLRLTFFPNGRYHSWTEHRSALQPLVDAGQVQLGNHTWAHPNLTLLSASAITDELTHNHRFLLDTYGVDSRPWFRPPYGRHDARTDAVAASLGYTRVTLWNGTFGDFTRQTEAAFLAQARQWLQPGHMVIGHANHPTAVPLFDQILGLILDGRCTPRTLTDVFGAPDTRTRRRL